MIFNPLRKPYKTPQGAAPEGAGVEFVLTLPYSLGCVKVELRLYDEDYREIERVGILWESESLGSEIWRGKYTFIQTGLFFYRFALDLGYGGILYGADEELDAVPGGGYFQQTVYSTDFKTSSKFYGGIIYQIFPDRFYASQTPKEDIYPERTRVDDKKKQPEYKSLDKKTGVQNNDYYGGDFNGIIDKLDYLNGLGVSVLYINPIFEAHSNHRYNTADYTKTDPFLGSIEDFKRLCAKAHGYGMSVILDGVFSHTGSDSVYFNAQKRYGRGGAANDKASPYYSWYIFTNWPDEYVCWWDVASLPAVDKTNPEYIEFIAGKNGIIEKWLAAGADGWRLDVADELPEDFLVKIRKAAKSVKKDSLIIGEVWENASDKISYGARRHYLLGRELDSVMNYPAYEAIISFVRGADAKKLAFTLEKIYSDYPKPVCDCLMNHIGTHDSPRLITRLAGEPLNGRPREWQSKQSLTKEQYEKGVELVRLASFLSYTIYGLPSLYYGDETGMQGYADPFNRCYFNWDSPDINLTEHYRLLGKARRKTPAFADGDFEVLHANGGLFAFLRSKKNQTVLCALNRGDENCILNLPPQKSVKKEILAFNCKNNKNNLVIKSKGFGIFELKQVGFIE